MVKVKRFQNPQKEAPSPQCATHPATQDMTHSSPMLNSVQLSQSLETFSHATSNNSTPLDSSSTPNNPQESQAPTRHGGRVSNAYWTVEAIDSKDEIKKIKVKELNNFSKDLRIIVEFDDQWAAYGEAQGLLAGYCGSLAIDCKLFPINFERWSGKMGIPNSYFEDCFETFLKPRFCFKTTEALAKRYCKMSIGKKWAASRQRVWDNFYDKSKTRDEIISNFPKGIDPIQWAHFVNYRLKPETVERCNKNKEIRSKQVIPHTGGSKPLARKRHEMVMTLIYMV
ncbi:hypothetical protein QL285_069121 [Trifolium repens]|nr:hypothetical protein QL285_069121 [Trifolium repens]